MSSFRRLPVLLCAFLTILPLASRAADAPKETWLGIYFGGRKIGYTSIVSEGVEYHGQPAMKLSSTSVVRMEMFGNKVSQDTSSVTWTDRTWRPIYQEYVMSSNGSTTTLKADYQPGKILCTVGPQGSESKVEVPVPPGANLSVDSPEMVQGKKLAVGEKVTLYYLNPLTIKLDRSDVSVVGQGQVKLAGKPYSALRVVATTPFGTLSSWESTAGETLMGDMPLGMRMFRETKQVAQNLASAAPAFVVVGNAGGGVAAYKPPKDFAVATAVKTDRPIANPRGARDLSISVSGITDAKLVLSDARQHATAASTPGTYRLDIAVRPMDASHSALLPITEPSVQPYLRAAPYLEIGDPQIKETAEVLRGKETNAYKVALAIANWVHENMRPDYTIGVPRSCTDVYKRRRGVCRDYATLFAGIARAAGIPTRVVGGMVYANGRFYYHAWDECWVGDWTALDPTIGGGFVDATHVKFAQGDVTDMFNVGSVIGRIKVKVLKTQ